MSARLCVKWRLLGPHFYFDLLRLARKSRIAHLRVVFLGVLFGGIWLADDLQPVRQFANREPEPVLVTGTIAVIERSAPTANRNEIAQFNSACIYYIFLIQNVAILLLAPVYVGGAIAEERDRRTLEQLFCTALLDREIAFGKLAARVVHLGGLLLAALPVFSLMLVLGGIDMTLLLANEVHSFALLLTVSCLCMAISTIGFGSAASIIISYLAILFPGPWAVACFPGALEHAVLNGEFVTLALAFGCVYGAVGYAGAALAVKGIRARTWPARFAEVEAVGVDDGRDPLPIVPAQPVLPPAHPCEWVTREEIWPPRPCVSDDALLWKEKHTGGRPLLISPLAMILAGAVLLPLMLTSFVGSVVQTSAARNIRFADALWLQAQELAEPLFGGYGLFLGLAALGVAFRAAGTVVCERQGRTLDMLLQIPGDAADILRAKWHGAIHKGRPWYLLLMCDIAIGVLVGACRPADVAILAVAAVLLVWLACNLGILLSVIARSRLQANLILAVLLLAIGGASYLCHAPLTRRLYFSRVPDSQGFFGISALDRLVGSEWLALALVAACMAVLGHFLWRRAVSIFEKSRR